MTTYSKQAKKQSLGLILILALIALFSVAMAFGSLNTNTYGFTGNPVAAQAGTVGNASLNVGNSVASDLQYWSANCSHGWTTDSTCDVLASLTQSCFTGFGVRSAYCSEYESYLQQTHRH